MQRGKMDYAIVALLLLLTWVRIHVPASFFWSKKSSSRRLPPGPAPLPLVGNLFQLEYKPHNSLAELARTHGPLMTLQLGRIPTMIITLASMAKDVLRTHDVSFSDRMDIGASHALGNSETWQSLYYIEIWFDATLLLLIRDLFGAGPDTTSTTFEWAMAELLHNPEKIKKAQAELREVIGAGNPVGEGDIVKLPYLQCIIKETLRLNPPVPFLIPRKVANDVELHGFTVPKGAQVLVNAWAIARDASLWENPESFEPERFLGSEVDVKGRDFELIPFGAGHRTCPILPSAMKMLRLMLAALLHSFDWKLEDGESAENTNIYDEFGLTLQKAQPLRATPIHI